MARAPFLTTMVRSLRAQAPVPYMSGGSQTQWAWPFLGRGNPEAQMKSMGQVGSLFAIVNRLSNAVSQVPWKLYRSAASGKPEDRVEVTSHLALDIWNKPNKFYTRQELVETVQQHIDLVGEGWTIISRNASMRSVPLELWPVRPDRMAPVQDPTEFIKGYIYMSPGGVEIPLEMDDVMFIRMPNPLDPYRGMGPVQAILTEIDSVRYSAEWNRNFFLNSAEPGGIVKFDRTLGDTEWRTFVNRWREQHQGVAQAHRVAVLEEGEWIDRKYTQRDMQFAELHDLGVQDIRGAFGMPKFAVGDIDDVNRATADAVDIWFARYLMKPRLERWKGMLNNDYLPAFGSTGKGVEFDYDNPVPEDEEAENAERDSKVAAAKTLIVDCGFEAPGVLEYLDLPDLKLAPKPEPPPQLAPPAPDPNAPVPPGQAPPNEDVTNLARAVLALALETRASAEAPHPGVWH